MFALRVPLALVLFGFFAVTCVSLGVKYGCEPMQQLAINYTISPALSSAALNALFAAAWPTHRPYDFQPILARSLAYCCAFIEDQLIGFVNLAWDGGIHCFLLDTTVHPLWQRRGIGRQLVGLACTIARERGMEWLHVDYEPQLAPFYEACGFRPTAAGLIALAGERSHDR